ncbi:MAG: glycosyltransferase [Rhodocyclaceae bacterium]|nr:glycosyltransferase [Rhodocyclaceae bacterium]
MSGPAIFSLLWSKNVRVLERFARRYAGAVVVAPRACADAGVTSRIEAVGATFRLLESYLSPDVASAAKAASAERNEWLRGLLDAPAWADFCRRRGWDGWDGENSLAALCGEQFGSELERGMRTVAALDQAHSELGFGLVIVNEDLMPQARAVIAWAKARGVPSLCLSHSLILFDPYTIHGRIHADVLAVFGERALEGYADAGLDLARLQMTGNPAWDDYTALRPRRQEFRQRLAAAHHGLDAAIPWVVFGTTWAANLTAFCDEGAYGQTLDAFVAACKTLFDRNIAFQPVIKDRPQNAAFGLERLRAICSARGLAVERFRHVTDDAQAWVLAADVLISVDSNLSIEAMLAGTPAVNLSNAIGVALGPPFDADSGIMDVPPEGLADAVSCLLSDGEMKLSLLAAMDRAVVRYNVGVDGLATQRVVELMTQMAKPAATAARHPWQTLLDVADTEANQYHNWPRTQLFDLFSHPPRRVLDIGCGAGATGKALKDAFPGVETFGVEVNKAAAGIARQRMDVVMEGKFEEVDLEGAGIAPGSLDTVIVADVLEHMYDPWHVLTRLKNYLSPDAQVIASIPNIRNLVVMEELAKGNWRYEEWGLLDITHIRFFTLNEIKRFFHETGYRVTQIKYNLDGRLADFYNRHRHEKLFNVEFERLTLKNVTEEELAELCTLQIFVRAEPGAIEEKQFEQEMGEARPDYALWRAVRKLTLQEAGLWEDRLRSWPSQPRVHLAILVTQQGMSRIGATLDSLTGQLYENVTVTVVAEAPPPTGWQDSERLAWRDARDGFLPAVNDALDSAAAEWVGVVDAGDCLPPHALLFMMEAAARHPEWRFMYADEDAVTESGDHRRPHFKPDFNLDLLRSYPYLGGPVLVDRALFADIGGFDADRLGIEDHDLALRTWEKVGDGGIGHVAEVLLHRREGGGHVSRPLEALQEAGQCAVSAHLERLGVPASIGAGYLPLSWRVIYRHAPHTMAPRVSIVVVALDEPERIKRCIETLFAKTDYPDWELLVLDVASTDMETREFVAGLEALGDDRIRAWRIEQAASLAACHNLLAAEAGGDYLMFLHFDMLPLAADWLETLMNHACRPGVGAVGPRLLRSDGTVGKTWLALGMGGGAETAFKDIKLDDPGYFGRALLEQQVSAVGGGAFLTRREAFERMGGFDVALGTDAAETDYCLRLADAGLRIVWTPHASLLGEGVAAATVWSGTVDEPLAEQLSPRWLRRLATDPAYNRNLKRVREGAFALEPRTTLNWDPLPWKPLPRILAHPADNVGCGHYRIFGPMRALIEAGRVQGWTDYHFFEPVEIAPLELDAVILQRQTTDEQIATMERHHRHTKALKVFELDDLLIQLPGRSIHRTHIPSDVVDRLRRAVPLCDRFVVSTEPLAEAYRGLNGDIRVVKNTLERSRWGDLKPLRRQSAKPRVGWVGGIGHTGDLEMIADVVRELANEVDWVFMGMCPDALRPFIREYHNGVHFEQYPARVAALNLDLALAPLEINPFNEAKSHLRILEYGILGYPVVCSDIFPYQGDFPVTRVRNRTNDWIGAIRGHLADMDATAKMGDDLKRVIERDWMIEDHLDVWLAAWLP